jgi:hypothetical protein
VALSASTLDILFWASLSTRAAEASASLTRATTFSHVATASWALASTTHTVVAQAASTVMTASHARITSSYGMCTPEGPQDRRYKSKNTGV